MANIRKHAVAETTVLHVEDANGEPIWEGEGEGRKPVTITLYGPGSKQYQQALSKQTDKYLNKIRKHGKSYNESVEEKSKRECEFLADITSDTDNLSYPDENGADLDLSKNANLVTMYSDASIGFIKEQANKWAGDWANFVKASSKS
jgi:hypothetical protein